MKVAGLHIAGAVLLVLTVFGCDKRDSSVYRPHSKGSVTFTEHIAPIVFNNCSSCHRPGQSAPFNLLTYPDVQKRAKQIVDVTQQRYMPPWLPDASVVHFVGERRLTEEQLGLLKQWAEDGTPEGDGLKLPPLPKWPEGWQLGTPDLVLRPAVPFPLAAEGPDIYRNLVVALPVERRRFVRAIEFRPNSRAVHHAFMRFDKTSESRRRDGEDGKPGFAGIHAAKSAQSPLTQFASWQPGKVASFSADDAAWPLDPNTDLVLQLHLQSTGKEEVIAPELAFYFTDKPPTIIPFKLPLNTLTFEIPAGASNVVVEDSYVLPVDAEIRGVLPHAHYIAKRIEGIAQLPNGKTNWLMLIPQWDFNWQGDYRYVQPLQLPKGTKLQMRITYDNSDANPRNRNHPPKPVRYGLQSTDEMAELWLLLALKSETDLDIIDREMQSRFTRDSLAYNQYLVRIDPKDGRAQSELGFALYSFDRFDEATQHLHAAVALLPEFDHPHYVLGLLYRRQNQLDAAITEFYRAVQLNPRNGKARGNLGLVLAQQGRYGEATDQFRAALAIDPTDAIAQKFLRELGKQR